MLRFGDFELDLERVELRRGGKRVALQPKAYRLLAYLAEQRDRVVPRPELFEQLWAGQVVSESSLNAAIKQIRAALGDDGGEQTWIRTYPGFGYRFVSGMDSEPPSQPVLPAEPPLPAAARPFVGRRHELAMLRRAASESFEGRGRVIFVAGAAGIGKTRLCGEVVEHAVGWGARCLSGRCHDGEGAPSFWPWISLLRELAPMGGAAVRQVLQALLGFDATGNLANAGGAVPGSQPEQRRFQLFESVAQTLQEAAERQPLVVLLDDLHWADSPSLLLLRHVSRRLSRQPVLMLATFRDDEVPDEHPLSQVAAAVLREPRCELLRLAGLDDGDAGALLASLELQEIDAARVLAMARAAEGNPFFLLTLAQHVAQPGADARHVPQGIRALVQARTDRLSDACRTLLRHAAVAGPSFSIAVLARLRPAAATSSPEPMTALDEAQRAGLIVGDAEEVGRYRFGHALLRESIYAAMAPAERAALHLEIAQALLDIEARAGVVDAEELAHHFARAAPLAGADAAIHYARRAAAEACSKLAFETALQHYQGALALLPLARGDVRREHCELLLDLAETEWILQDFRQVRARCDEAYRLAQDLCRDDPSSSARARLARATLGFTRQQPTYGVVDPISVSRLEESLAAMGEDDAGLRARLLARLSWILYPSPASLARSLELSEAAVAVARRMDDPESLLTTLHYRRWVLWGPLHHVERAACVDEMLRVAQRSRSQEMLATAHGWRLFQFLEGADGERFERELESFTQLSEALQRPWYRWYAALFQGVRAQCAGDFDQAEVLAGTALEIWRPHYEDDALQMYGAQIAALRLVQGRFAEMTPFLETYAVGQPGLQIWEAALALALAESGRHAEAKQRLDALAPSGFAALPQDNLWLATLWVSALAAARIGHGALLADLWQSLRPFAGRVVVTGSAVAALGPVEVALAACARGLGRKEEAGEAFAAAMTMATRGRMPAWCRRIEAESAG